MKYMEIRCDILRENMQWARQDLKTVWPTSVFSTDLYAIWALGDGTDPLNQAANDIPSTHVFIDWGQGKLGVIGGSIIGVIAGHTCDGRGDMKSPFRHIATCSPIRRATRTIR